MLVDYVVGFLTISLGLHIRLAPTFMLVCRTNESDFDFGSSK